MTAVRAAGTQLAFGLFQGAGLFDDGSRGGVNSLGDIEAVTMASTREPQPRTYWEHTGPGRWQQVVVRVRYGPAPSSPPPGPVLPLVTTGRTPPRNVLVERPDGSTVVRPVRLLRTRCPT